MAECAAKLGMRSPVCVCREQGRNRHTAYGLTVDESDEILRRVVHPVGLQPFNNIIVAREEDDLPFAAPPCLGKGSRAYFGNLPVDNGGELIDHRMIRTLRHQSCPELLAVAQHMERAEP